MDGGNNAICYMMQPCTTEEDVHAHCGSLIYSCHDVQTMHSNGYSTQSNFDYRNVHLVLRQEKDKEPQTIVATDLSGIAIDPLIMDNTSPDENALGGGTDSQFEVNRLETTNIFDATQAVLNDQQMMDCIPAGMNWSVTESLVPQIDFMSQLPGCRATAIVDEENTMISELWDESFGRMEPHVNGDGVHSGWTLPLAST
ncbi:uncharacterized protein UV8b_04123 [Ustilaginoidea virens]|nr:uncharacterized protein UV8b_04123 [Ustilaginoidea virens]QUC19882.1 hypothetical protein UV8b_04123 [Ustilaginoidea virens]